MKTLIKQILRETLFKVGSAALLNENVAQAEKILKANNIPLDSSKYLKIKDLLLKNNNIGYLGLIVKLAVNSGGSISLDDVYSFILDNKQILNRLPKQLQAYDNFSELSKDVEGVKNSMLLKKITDKLTNPIIKEKLPSVKMDNELKNNIEFFLGLKSSDQKEFLSKSDKYKDVDTFISDLEAFNEDIRSGFSYQTVMKKISGLNESEIKVLFHDEEKKLILARILKYSASRMIGSQSWCIVGDEDHFRHYTDNGKNFQYFLFNFNSTIPANEKMLAFTMNAKNEVTAAHDRYDREFSDPVQYLTKIGIHRRVVEINSRERKETSLASLGDKNGRYRSEYSDWDVLDANSRDYEKFKTFERDRPFEIKLSKIGLNFLSLLLDNESKGKSHLDIVLKKFESYPFTIYDDTSKEKIKQRYNIVVDALHKVDKLLSNQNELFSSMGYVDNNYDYYDDEKTTHRKITKKEVVDVMTKIYSSSMSMSNDTKRAILHFLKDNDVDILKLSQQKKAKSNKDLGDMEFAMLKNRGEDMKPLIQNKLAALRRGEDVNLSVSEIKYAIENGFKPIIEKYYKNQIPAYAEHQLSYDDMTIYKELGLLKDVAEVIYQKGKYWGVDALNSIEKSIYDMFARTQNKAA